MLKFNWKYDYVPEGQVEPDEHNRWALNCYLYVHIDKALPQYDWVKNYGTHGEYIEIQIAQINQKGTQPGIVPSTIHKFAAGCPSFWEAANLGFSKCLYLYSNDLEELKSMVEKELNQVHLVFQNCLKEELGTQKEFRSVNEQKIIWSNGLQEFSEKDAGLKELVTYGNEWGKVSSDAATNLRGDILGNYYAISINYIKPFISDKNFLEIGCLDGKWVFAVLYQEFDKPKKIIAVDIIPDGFQRIRKWLKQDPENLKKIEFYLTKGYELNAVPSNSVDYVFSMDTLVRSEIEVIDLYLGEIKRVLTPDGRACIHLPCQEQPLSHELGFTQFDTEQLTELLKKHDIANCRIDKTTINHGVLLLINIT